MSHPVVHWEIGGADVDALREFYGKVFGWEMTDAGPAYTVVDTGAGGLTGGFMRTPEGVPPYATIYVRVDDLAATLETIIELGGAVLVPPTVIDDTLSFAMFVDPQATVVGLLHQAA